MTSPTNNPDTFDAAAETDKTTEAARVQAQLERVTARTPERRRRRFKLQGSTVVLAAVVLAGTGFVAGARVGTNVQKNRNASSSGIGAAGFGRGNFGAGGFGGGTGAGGLGTGGFGAQSTGSSDPLAAALSQASSATTTVPVGPQISGGSITLVDGNTIYVETPSGETVVVETDGSTKVSQTAAGSTASLVEGAHIFLTGLANANGEIKATEVVVSPAP